MWYCVQMQSCFICRFCSLVFCLNMSPLCFCLICLYVHLSVCPFWITAFLSLPCLEGFWNNTNFTTLRWLVLWVFDDVTVKGQGYTLFMAVLFHAQSICLDLLEGLKYLEKNVHHIETLSRISWTITWGQGHTWALEVMFLVCQVNIYATQERTLEEKDETIL